VSNQRIFCNEGYELSIGVYGARGSTSVNIVNDGETLC
jgi:hypothetical protein